jgi:hypothetical protein
MATPTFKPIAVNGSGWQDIVPLASSQNGETISGLNLQVQARCHGCYVFIGGSSAPVTTDAGWYLNYGESVPAMAADYIWVKGSGVIVVGEDINL